MSVAKLEVITPSGGKKPLYNSVRRFAMEGLNDLIRVLMESVDDALFELSDKVDNDRERNMYFEAMRELRLKREGLQKNFDLEMQECFEHFLNGTTRTGDSDTEQELTLVEIDDLEDSIAIENMISRARPHFEDDLFAVSERLKTVLRRKQIGEDENPLDPKAICDSFHSASELLETDIEVKLIFYKLFEKYVMSNLGHFYREMNDLFIRKGVLPEFKAEQERMKQTTRFMANRIKQSGDHAAEVNLASPASAATLRAVPGNDGNLFAALQQAIGGAASSAYGGQPVGGGYASDAFEPAGGVVEEPQGGGFGAAPQGGGFVSALTNLQTASAQGGSLSGQAITAIDPQNVRATTQQQLINFRQENQHQFTTADNQTIDVISMLFDFFFDDEALPAPIKVLIGRLQIPILKVAIIDKDFFNQKKHPARKLLDSISRASLGWGDNHADQQALIDKAEEIVNYLIEEFDEDVAVFEQALTSFEQFLNQESESIDETEQKLQQQEQAKDQQIEHAQKAASDLIDKLTQNRDLSFEVIDFLETTWTSVLFNAHLSLGESSRHWSDLKRISTTFVWSLLPKFSEEERVKIIKTIPALLRALSRGMDLVKINSEVQNRIFQLLAREHAKIVKQTSKNIVTRIDDETVWPEDNGAEAFASAQGIDPAAEVDFEFSPDDTGEVQIVDHQQDDDSITVISEASTGAVISDLNEFAESVKQGDITIHEEIILESEDDLDAELEETEGDYLEQAEALEIGSWVEFIESQSKTLVARLSWKSNVTGSFVFVNRQGHKVRNMSLKTFAAALKAGDVRNIESASVFDRAINTIMTRQRH